MARCLMSARWLMPSASRLSSAAPRSLLPQYQPHAGAYGVEEHMGEHMGESREVPVVVLHVQISGADASPLGGDQVAPLSSEQVRRRTCSFALLSCCSHVASRRLLAPRSCSPAVPLFRHPTCNPLSQAHARTHAHAWVGAQVWGALVRAIDETCALQRPVVLDPALGPGMQEAERKQESWFRLTVAPLTARQVLSRAPSSPPCLPVS